MGTPVEKADPSPADDVPKEYVPYKHLEMLGNVFKDVRFLIEIGNAHPFLIGQGEHPQVWISIRTRGGEWRRIVEGNKSRHPDVVGEYTRITDCPGEEPVQTGIALLVKDKCILKVRSGGGEKAVVDHIDLRPVGIAMYGEDGSLRVGNLDIGTSVFDRVGTAFHFES